MFILYFALSIIQKDYWNEFFFDPDEQYFYNTQQSPIGERIKTSRIEFFLVLYFLKLSMGFKFRWTHVQEDYFRLRLSRWFFCSLSASVYFHPESFFNSWITNYRYFYHFVLGSKSILRGCGLSICQRMFDFRRIVFLRGLWAMWKVAFLWCQHVSSISLYPQ